MIADDAKNSTSASMERPGNPEAQVWQVEPMLAEVRAYRLRELREMLAMTQTTWQPSWRSVRSESRR